MRIEVYLPIEKVTKTKFAILEEVNKVLAEDFHSEITLSAVSKLMSIDCSRNLSDIELAMVKTKLVESAIETFAKDSIFLEINDFTFKVIS